MQTLVPSDNADIPNPAVTQADAAAADPPAMGDAATTRHAAGPSMLSTCSCLRTVLSGTPLAMRVSVCGGVGG